MPPATKRRRKDKDCDGDGCGGLDCDSCWCDLDEDGLPSDGDLDFIKPSQRARAEAMLKAIGKEPKHYSPPNEQRQQVNSHVQSYACGLNPSIKHMIDALNEETLRNLVFQLANIDQWVANGLTTAYNAQQRLAPTNVPAIDFDYLSKSAWHALNDRSLLRSSSSRQFDAADGVWETISQCVDTIQQECNVQGALIPLRTRQSAIETLRKIAKTILLGEDALGREVRKQLQHESCIADVMLEVLEEMTPEERVATGKIADAKGSLMEKVRWVRDESKGYCLDGLSGLDEVLEMLETGEGGSDTSESFDED